MCFEIYGFINCLCTYLSHIYKWNFGKDDYLYFLADKMILVTEKKKKKENYEENPWRFQPFIIGNEILQEDSLFEQFCAFLEKNCKIMVHKKKKLSLLKEVGNQLNYYILPVDEFYLDKSSFFKKKHNQHFLLIKKVYKNYVVYFDSEIMGEQVVNMKMLRKAINSKILSEYGYIVSVEHAKRMELEKCMTKKIYDIPYIEETFYARIDSESFLFYIEALRLSIVFQIIPYLIMLIECCECDGGNLLYLYQQLAQYLLICKLKKKVDRNEVIIQIKKINAEGESLKQRSKGYPKTIGHRK